MIFFENEIAISVSVFFKIVYNVVLVVYVVPVFKNVIKDKKQLLLFLLIAIIDLVLLGLLMRSDNFLEISLIHKIVLNIQVFLLIFLLLTTSSYTFGHFTKASHILLLFVLAFSASDFFTGLGYYLGWKDFYVVDQILHITGLGIFSYFSLIPKRNYLAKF